MIKAAKIKKQESPFLKFINKHFHVIIYCSYFLILMFLLSQSRLHTLLSSPLQGTDQYKLLETSKALIHGTLPNTDYSYSLFYTLFLSILEYLSSGNLVLMRMLQSVICAFIPVYIYKFARRLRFGRENSQIAAFIYCLYGASALVLLDFSFSALLSLFFLLFAYFSHKAFTTGKWRDYLLAGIYAAFCLLCNSTFIIILTVPLIILIFPQIRERIHLKKKTGAWLICCIVVLPFIIYNIVHLGTLSILSVANPDTQLSLNTSIPDFAIISSYEIPMYKSIYTFYDIVDFMVIFIVPFNFLIGLAILAFVSGKRYRELIFTALFIIIYFLSILYSNNFYRYRAPIVPLLSVMGAGAFFAIRKTKSIFKVILYLAFLILFTSFTYINPESLRSDDEKRAVADILIYTGRFEKAHAYLDKIENEGVQATDQWVSLIREICRTGDIQWSLEVEYTFLKHLKKRAKGKLIIPSPPDNKCPPGHYE